jgi:putative transposase
MNAQDRETALEELALFQQEYEAKYPKAVECLTKDVDHLFSFMNYPAAHWLHLRTTNAIESTFATVKARTRVTKGAGSRDAALAMAFKLLTQAEGRWRRVNSAHLVALVAAGVKFPDGRTRILPDLPSNSVVNLQVDVAFESAIHNI